MLLATRRSPPQASPRPRPPRSQPNNLTLTTTKGVGTATQPLNASLTPGGVLNVQAGSQGVYVTWARERSWAVVSSGGDVVLSATGSLDPAPGLPSGTVNVTGNNVTLSSASGEVGTAAAPLVIQASGPVDVAALMDIGLTQADGNLEVDQIVSTTGDVTVDVPSGSIINASSTAWADEVSDAASKAIWQNLGLTKPGRPCAAGDHRLRERSQRRLRGVLELLENGSVQNGVFTLSSAGIGDLRCTGRQPRPGSNVRQRAVPELRRLLQPEPRLELDFVGRFPDVQPRFQLSSDRSTGGEPGSERDLDHGRR